MGKIKTTRGQHFKAVIQLVFRVAIGIVLLQDAFIQLASALAMDCRTKPVDTKIPGDIIPVRIKVSHDDHLAETLQHQRQEQTDDDYSLNYRCIQKEKLLL
jgi:hypothetical protein